MPFGSAYGDPLAALCYLNLAALRHHDVEAVRSLAGQVMTAAEAATTVLCHTGKATMAWVAWKDRRLADVVPIATEALELWAAICRHLSVQMALSLAGYSGPPLAGSSPRRSTPAASCSYLLSSVSQMSSSRL